LVAVGVAQHESSDADLKDPSNAQHQTTTYSTKHRFLRAFHTVGCATERLTALVSRRRRLFDVDDSDSSSSDSSDSEASEDTACEVCKSCDNGACMLLCDGCDRGFHMSCLRPILTMIPSSQWHCSECAQSQLRTRCDNTTPPRADVCG